MASLQRIGLTGRESHPNDTVIQIGQTHVGAKEILVIADLCDGKGKSLLQSSEDSDELWLHAALLLQQAGVRMLRVGKYIPDASASPYRHHGFSQKGLYLLDRIRREMGFLVAIEVVEKSLVNAVADIADVLQVGTPNMHNFYLLQELGKAKKPVVIKRGLNASIEEWLTAAEYIMEGGNGEVILCERGHRSFEPDARTTLDLCAVAFAKNHSHLPVIVDVSHGTRLASLVPAMSKASIAAGADGLMIDVINRQEDPSDELQAVGLLTFSILMGELGSVALSVGSSM